MTLSSCIIISKMNSLYNPIYNILFIQLEYFCSIISHSAPQLIGYGVYSLGFLILKLLTAMGYLLLVSGPFLDRNGGHVIW